MTGRVAAWCARPHRPFMRAATACVAAALLLLSGCAEPAQDQLANSAAGTTANSTTNNTTSNTTGSTSNTATNRSERSTSNNARDLCVVASVTDGDSMRCVAQGRVRLLLLDAPEMSQPPFGAQSRDALRRLINRGDTVWLEYDLQREDQYGRTLAHVWTSPDGGTHVNLAQAAGGWAVAVVFQPNVRYIEAIRRAVATARQERRGLWADGKYRCPPADHKRGNC